MDSFINDDFLLRSESARILYHDCAKHLPIIDFHNHLSPKDIALDRIFDSITKLWLEGDHYKWRAMRSCGTNEEFITGTSSDWEKFQRWSSILPKLLLNPLYHWTHLELSRYFNIDILLNEASSRFVYDSCNEKVKSPEFSVRNLLRKMNVEYSCSTEDPINDLKWHRILAKEFEIAVSAAFRPDKLLNIDCGADFPDYLKNLSEVSQTEVSTFSTLCEAIEKRHNYFHEFGCRLSDIALDWFKFNRVNASEANRILRRVLQKKKINLEEINAFRTTMLIFLCELNHSKGWVQQFHIGALRNVNSRGKKAHGEASGFDSMNDVTFIPEIGKLLNSLESENKLSKSIFFNLNPRDNAALLALIQSFSDGLTDGKMQYGPAWWFLDNKEGIEQNLKEISIYSVLGNFIGMITDSRSFLSFVRHEYFRRILCNFLANEMNMGTIPSDFTLLKELVENICYHNVKKYLEITHMQINPQNIKLS